MNAFLLGTLIILGSIVFAVGGLFVVRRLVPRETLKANHEVAGVMIAVLGTLYAVLLGLVVVDALAHRELAETMESNEANSIATVMHLVLTLPLEKRRPILKAALNYCELAVAQEWTKLQQGTAPDKATMRAFGDFWEVTSGYEPMTPKEQNLHAGILTAMSQFSDARRYRIVACKLGIPSLLWLVLVTGGFCTIGFTYFFGAESLTAQAVMTTIVSFVLCLNVLLVFFYGRPYTGDMHINPDNLTHVRDILRKAPALQKNPPPEILDEMRKEADKGKANNHPPQSAPAPAAAAPPPHVVAEPLLQQE